MTALSSTLTWAQLRDLECAELESAADGWGKASNRADAGRDRIEKQLLVGLRESQRGAAAEAAAGRLRRMSRNLQYVYTECGLIRTALNSLAHEMRVQQGVLRRALEEAESLKFTVHADGSVSYPPGPGGLFDGDPLPGGTARASGVPGLLPSSGLVAPHTHAAAARDISDRVTGAVRAAARIDWRFTRILRRLRAEEGLKVPDRAWTDAAGDAAAVREAARGYLESRIPRGGAPAAVREWWAHLTDEQREEYLAVYPDRIGNLDGIPSLIRDTANRDNLQLLIGKLEGRDDEVSRVRLAGLREIGRQLEAGGQPPMYLLGIGDEGNGRAIVSYGNPDTARNVAAYVPGLNTSLDEEFARGDLKRARDTAIGAKEMDPDASVASIVWLGYDAPQTSMDDPLGVTGQSDAKAGAAAYNQFMAGISATNQHADPHVTAIGHSYGSLTVGLAAQEKAGIPGADDVVLVGSPGTGARFADELGVGRGHVFVGAAENDPVTKLPNDREASGLGAGIVGGASAGFSLGLSGGPVGAAVGGVAGGVAGGAMGFAAQDAQSEESDVWFGTDPAHRDFGATRFAVSEGPRPLEWGHSPGEAHSNYFDPAKDQVSADNIARIVAGKSDEIERERPR
ncbi:alpha/beta hydrolase [Streptomyces drozdowiczii]|uniref:Alpha/beta hydrolase family protein n=1 Tax=Streptomyces drozdowiczii TaxID=202862 RepID=A0ABY6PT05_9ACTN|nr:alpha/beta hydrolase [Streptomyces drozdowiczii]MCX0245085.1 alpha/beta hydrolase family protein [Streptomyces drozdowiczii]UZK55227.1 alpha/beta hydrolase family protein [Streptomyces drozdowiczii]